MKKKRFINGESELNNYSQHDEIKTKFNPNQSITSSKNPFENKNSLSNSNISSLVSDKCKEKIAINSLKTLNCTSNIAQPNNMDKKIPQSERGKSKIMQDSVSMKTYSLVDTETPSLQFPTEDNYLKLSSHLKNIKMEFGNIKNSNNKNRNNQNITNTSTYGIRLRKLRQSIFTLFCNRKKLNLFELEKRLSSVIIFIML